MAFKKTVGAQGIVHLSEAEALLSFPLFSQGIVSDESFYPASFSDGKGGSFRAKKDFSDKHLSDISYEVKSGSLNGLSTCAAAANAMAIYEQELAAGYIKNKDKDYRRLMASWSASPTKFKCVQYQEAAAGRIVLMVYDKKPPPKTLSRLERSKVLWCVHGDDHWYRFLQFRLRARLGVRSSCLIKGHLLETNGGQPLADEPPKPKATRKAKAAQ